MTETAFEKARSAFLQKNLDTVPADSGAELLDDNIVSVLYFDTIERISVPDCSFDPEIGEIEKVLIFHYLAGKSSRESEITWASYGNLPGGMFYDKTFERRGPERIRKAFGERGNFLFDAAEALGGTREAYKDVSVRIRVLPNVDVIVVVTFADDELGSEANILFENKIADFLSLEDIAFLGDMVAKRLCRFLEKR